jgi:hypothetical protein
LILVAAKVTATAAVVVLPAQADAMPAAVVAMVKVVAAIAAAPEVKAPEVKAAAAWAARKSFASSLSQRGAERPAGSVDTPGTRKRRRQMRDSWPLERSPTSQFQV